VSIDIDKIRAETPGVETVNHLLACGSALMPQPVIDAITGHIELEARIGGYEAHAEKAEQLDDVYQQIATLIGASPREIALQENATIAWCFAFYSLPLKPGQRILTCEAEYAANYVAFLQREKRDGVIIDIIPSDETGALDTLALEDMIDERVGLIAITWIPTNGGLVNPAEKVGQIARRHGIPYLLDGCQALGQMPIDVTSLGCDFFSATGRKFLRGPRGTGFLYVRDSMIDTTEPVMIDHFAAPWVDRKHYELRQDARRFETWENAYALRAGLAAAATYAMSIGIDLIHQRAWKLAVDLRLKLRTIPGTIVHDIGARKCAIVSFSVDGLEPRETVASLRSKGINIGASDPASTRLDSESRNLPTLLRAAPHYYNTEDELDQLVRELKKLA